MRSRMFSGRRCWTAVDDEAGMGVEMATRTQSSMEIDDAGDRRSFERDGDGGVVQVAVEAAAQVGDRLDAMEDGRGEQEGEDGERG